MLLTVVLICVAVLALLIAVPAYIAFATHNRLVALDQRCETAFGDVDVHLKHRHNLIPPLVETVRGFAKHESEILQGVTQARAEALQAASPEMRLSAEQNLTQNINALIGMAERYPDLKASTHFSDLRRELVDAENRVTASRRFYNLAVEEYGTTLRQFPGSTIGRLFKMNVRMRFDLGIERAERVAAIVAVTGSMAVIAPAHRDTRRPELRAREGFGRRLPPLETGFLQQARQSANAAFARVAENHEFNRLGLTREMSVGAVLAIGVFLWVHKADLRNPAALVAALDPDPMRTFFALAAENAKCMRQGLGGLVGVSEMPADCRDLEKKLKAHSNDGGFIGNVAASMSEGTFRSGAPPLVQLREIQDGRCFQTESYSVGDRGLHSVTEQPKEGDTISLPRYLASGDAAAQRVVEATSELRDARLVDYFKVRKTTSWVIHRFFGEPGLQEAAVRYGYYAHQTAVAMLRQRIADPDFAPTLRGLERAELDVLAAAPMDFISCTARRAQSQKVGLGGGAKRQSGL
jgi:LemA protein